MSREHLLIAFEGMDGLGKSTLADRVAERAHSEGHPFTMIREPGSSPLGETLRPIIKDPEIPRSNMADVFLFNAARVESARRIGELILKQNLITDRSWISTVAYQGFGAEEYTSSLLVDQVYGISQSAAGQFARADLWVWFDAPYEVSAERQKDMKQDRFEGNKERYEKIRRGYGHVFRDLRNKGESILQIDATEPIETIEQKIWNVIKELL